jgi:arabinose-5-phosphate isomerase
MLAKPNLDPSANHSFDLTALRRLNRARKVCRSEAAAILALESMIDDEFLKAVTSLLCMRGSLIVTGVGKAGLIGQKLTATFASTGTPSHFVHPSEALHGDLGRVGEHDLVLVLSNSGESEEITRLLPNLKRLSAGIIAMTARDQSTLGKAADIRLILPTVEEACSHRLAPTSSTATMLALGDALAVVVSDERGFAADDFARYHPGGSLGMKLKFVDEVMRPNAECRIAQAEASIREVFVQVAKPGRRTGAIMLVDLEGKLAGLFTDSDLARILEQRAELALDRPIADFMKRSFTSIVSGSKLSAALALISERKISELPVVDDNQRPLGLIDITDVVAWLDSTQRSNVSLNADESSNTDDLSESSPTLRVFPT